MLKIILSFILVVSFGAHADSFTGNMSHRKGIWITPKDNSEHTKSLSSGQTATIRGTLCAVKWNSNQSNPKCKKLLENLPIKAYFPDATTDVSGSLVLIPKSGGKEIDFEYTTPALSNLNPNQFTIVVGNSVDQAVKLLKIQSKLYKRIMHLQKRLVHYQNKPTSFHGRGVYIEWITNYINYLNGVNQNVNKVLEDNPNVLAQMTMPLQVDNKPSGNFYYTSVFSGMKLALSAERGLPFEGEKINLTAKLTNLSHLSFWYPRCQGDHDDDDDEEEDEDSPQKYLYSLKFNGQTVASFGATTLPFGESKIINYTSPSLSPQDYNIQFETKRIISSKHHEVTAKWGLLSYDLNVLEDLSIPFLATTFLDNQYVREIAEVSGSASDAFGLLDQSTFKITQNNIDITSNFIVDNSGSLIVFNGNLNPLAEGSYNLKFDVKDLAGNAAASLNRHFVIDRTNPVINIALLEGLLTNNPILNIALNIVDSSPTETVIIMNGSEIQRTSDQVISLNVSLIEGINQFQFNSIDAAGNIAEVKQLNFIQLDTTPPILTAVIPPDNSINNTLDISTSGNSNEALAQVLVNGLPAVLSGDKKSFTKSVSAPSEGNYQISFEATDLAGNSTSINRSVQVVLQVLNKDLIAISPNENTGGLNVTGMPGAARPGILVHFNSGHFNNKTAYANPDGSFEVAMNPFTSVDISATDTASGRSDSFTLYYNVDTTLAGVIKDNMEMPLPGATITISGSGQTAISDSSGTFRIPNPATGDQTLYVDGGTIPLNVTGPNRKFSKIALSVSIGVIQSNVLDRPIYLTPLMFDGSETHMTSGAATTVTSPHAPGVALDIPAGVTTFPDGTSSGNINMMEISANVTSIAPLDFAVPQTVIALEPSGLKFDQPVTLTLPNVNEFPPGMQIVIMSKNSVKGIWEINGVGRVSSDGNSVITLPGQGITHFSEVYAAPLGPTVKQIGGQDKPGANTFEGALSTSVSMPSYKVLGTDVAPTLIYKSAWARPNVVISNLFDVPRQEFFFSGSGGGRSLFGSGSVAVEGRAWVEPDFLDVQFFTENIHTDKMRFTGIPNQSAISYAMDLASISSGVSPYFSHFEMHLKQMIVGTRTITTKKLFKGARTSQESFAETRAIEQVFPSDLSGPIFVQNKINSPAGSGWMVAGPAKIANPNNPRLLLEEGDGSISSYNVNDTIETIYHNPAVTFTEVGLNNLEHLPIFDEVNSNVHELNLSGSSPVFNYINYLKSFPYSGEIRQFVYSNCTCTRVDRMPYGAFRIYGSLLWGTNDKVLGGGTYNIPVISQIGSGNGGVFDISGRLGAPDTLVYLGFQDQFQMVNYCGSFGPSCIWNTYYSTSNSPVTQPPPACHVTDRASAISFCMSVGPGFQSNGSYPKRGFSDGANPQYNSIDGMIYSQNDPNIVVLSDTGNNRIRTLNLTTNVATTIAGNGQTFDSGDGGPATLASIYHPKNLVYDVSGNLYVTTERGYIRKISPGGVISTFAGKTAENGGFFSDSTPASEVLLNNPTGLAIDNNKGVLYVADTGHHRILQIDFLTLTAKLVAGSGACVGDKSSASSTVGDNKSGLNASFCHPEGVAVDPDGNLIIVDNGHSRIRRLNFTSESGGNVAYQPVAADNSALTKQNDGTFLRNFRSGDKQFFNSLGYMSKAQSRLGMETSYSYDINGRLLSQTDPKGGVITYFYIGNQLLTIQDPTGRITTLEYDGNKLTKVNFPDGSNKQYTYDANGLMVAETNQRGNNNLYEYNQHSRLTKVTRPDGTAISVSDSVSKTIGNNFIGGNIGSLKSLSDGDVYDGIKDAKGFETVFKKDESGFISTITDAKGQTTSVERDLEGRPLKITRPDDSYATFVYNSLGDLISRYDSSTGATVTFEYNSFGQLTRQVAANGGVATYSYDGVTGLLSSSVNPLGQTGSATYNNFGQVLTRTNSLGQTMSYVYDVEGNLEETLDPANNVTTFVRDAAGNVTSVTNAENQTVANQYDSHNRLLAVTDAKGATTSYEYLATGELSKITDPLGNITLFEYNSLGQLVKKTDSLGFETALTYDANGNVLSEIDPNGNHKTFEYDQLDMLTKKILPDNIYEYTFNVKGNLASAKNNYSEVTLDYTRTEAGDQVSTVQMSGLGDLADYPDLQFEYTYDVSGNKSGMISPYGNFAYAHDIGNRLTSVTNHKGQVFNFDFDNGNRLSKIQTPATEALFSFDNTNFLTNIVHNKRSPASVIESFEYTRNTIGNRTQKRSTAGDQNFAYDLNNQLTSATNPEDVNESFGYDAIGNRITDINGNFIYDNKKQRLIEDAFFIYTFDNNGNMTSKQKKNFGDVVNYNYSSENQLIGIEFYVNNALVKEAHYTYDVFGRRVQKQIVDHVDVNKSFIRRYAYDGSEILAELDDSNELLSVYTHSNLRTDDALAVDITTDGAAANLALAASDYYYVKDGLGTITDITNSSGQILDHLVYSSFGKLVRIEDQNGVDITALPSLAPYFTYTGREFDNESGLYFYRARFYDTNIGRFLQIDPDAGAITSPLTVNQKFSYCGNGPNNFVDPSGEFFINSLFYAAAVFGDGEIQEIGRSWIFAEMAFVAITASGGTGMGALKAIGSTAGGSALAAGAYAGAHGGNFAHHFSHAFHNYFRISVTFLAISALAAPGGVAEAGGNGAQGSISSNRPYFGGGTGLTIGSSATSSAGSGLAAHEFGHTLQFIAFSGYSGHRKSGLTGTWKTYMAAGVVGTIPMGPYNPVEASATGLGSIFY